MSIWSAAWDREFWSPMESARYTKLTGNTAKYPYLVGVVSRYRFGSGIVLSEGLILSCRHIGDYEDSLEIDTEPYVVFPSGPVPAVAEWTDERADLALLKLQTPVTAFPVRFRDAPLSPGERLIGLGVQELPERRDVLVVAEVALKYTNANEASGATLDMQLLGGARPGYSGGALLLEQKGMAHCVGMIRLGRDWSSFTNAIGMAVIRSFLERCLPGNRLLANREEQHELDLHRLEKAAIEGDLHAQYEWGLLQEHSQAEVAVHWLRKAAEGGHQESSYRLAVIYREGKGILPSKPESLRWLRNAAKLGHSEAQSELGRMLLDGSPGHKDAKEAAQLLERASAQGNIGARFQLAMLYYRGDLGIAQNDERAFHLLLQAAPDGPPAAQYYLAVMYSRGRGTPADPIAALRWAQSALNRRYETARALVRELSQR